MSGLPATAPFLSVEEYLVGEGESEVRHEYFGGIVMAMAGESAPHNLVAGALYSALRTRLRGGPCQVFIGGMKVHVRVADEDVFYYPDVLVACDPEDRHPYFRARPRVIVEVLSPTTEKKDRLEKYLAYQRIESLEEYLLVNPDPFHPRVTAFRRANDWRAEGSTEGDIAFPSLAIAVPLSEIYRD